MSAIESRIETLLGQMTLQEKIGQLWQINGNAAANKELIRQGSVGSCLNVVGADALEFQRIARQESRLKIPLIIGRDVIHGYKTVMPIPLGQAASFNPAIARDGARVAAHEASAHGVNWTFAPMVDISRDARWGRIAESCGEDSYLAGRMGAAMVEGFQGSPVETKTGGPKSQRAKAQKNLAKPGSIAACGKHYVGYGAAEGGRDYNSTLIPERTLRNVYLPPFQACVEAGLCTLMSAFNDLNDIPTSGNEFTLRQVLKKEWKFDGFVVSDWASIYEMIKHGYCADEKEAALKGFRGGVDMEMFSSCYRTHLEQLIAEGKVPMALVDDSVRRILRTKIRLGLFERPIEPEIPESVTLCAEHLVIARRAAVESCVLLKNDGVLPLSAAVRKVAVIGPLADLPAEQVGCWVMDGVAHAVQTPLAALRAALGADNVTYCPALPGVRSTDTALFPEAIAAARAADVVILMLGEDAGLSGEAHCRAFLDLPGAQADLVAQVAAVGKPVVAVVMAGRPLLLGCVQDQLNALLWAWHPGTMGGPAIVDLLFGQATPGGRLPVTFPRTVGQIPTYYNRKNTGRPPYEGEWGAPMGTPLDPKDFTSRYMDVDYKPLYPFGFGLSYTTFEFSPVTLSAATLTVGGKLVVSATVTNTGARNGIAVPQLYLHDVTGSATRPVRELKGFQKIELAVGESRVISFELSTDDLAYWNGQMKFAAEPGKFRLWIAADSDCKPHEPAVFELQAD